MSEKLDRVVFGLLGYYPKDSIPAAVRHTFQHGVVMNPE